MDRTTTTTLVVSAFIMVSLRAQQALIQPSSYGMNFEGHALTLECVAALKGGDARHLVETFRAKSSAERRVCLDQLQQSLTPEPDFTAADFQRALKQSARGSYELVADRTMTNRLGVNIYAARGIAALAENHLITDPSVLSPLIGCLNHPLLEVGKYCNRALTSLTLHPYGSRFFEQSAGAPAITVEHHQAVVADWRALDRLLAGGHPIFDQFIASESQAAIRAVAARLVALPLSGVPASYLRPAAESAVVGFATDEVIVRFDVGSHVTANWRGDEVVNRIGLLLFRPGLPRPSSDTEPLDRVIGGFQNPDYREIFDRLDLELRFVIGTSDGAVRQSSVEAVKAALDGLRAANANARR